MNTRLEQFLAAENISQSQLADTLGVARASISHILAGRNKPGYEFITNLMRCYPALNPEWLLLGKGKMYKEPVTTLFDTPDEPTDFDTPDKPTDESENQELTDIPKTAPAESDRKIIRVIAFYSDGTFEELS